MTLRIARARYRLPEADARRLRSALLDEGTLQLASGNRYVAAA